MLGEWIGVFSFTPSSVLPFPIPKLSKFQFWLKGRHVTSSVLLTLLWFSWWYTEYCFLSFFFFSPILCIYTFLNGHNFSMWQLRGSIGQGVKFKELMCRLPYFFPLLFNMKLVTGTFFFLNLSAGIAKFSWSLPSNKTQQNIRKAVFAIRPSLTSRTDLWKAEFVMEGNWGLSSLFK